MRRLMFIGICFAVQLLSWDVKPYTTAKAKPTNQVIKIEMSLSAIGVESDFLSIDAYIDLLNDSSSCSKSYYNPAFKPSIYQLTKREIKSVQQLVDTINWDQLKKEYRCQMSDQPTSTTKIFTADTTYVVKDYGLVDSSLQRLYQIVYKLDLPMFR